MSRAGHLISLTIIALILMGCGAKFVPIETDIVHAMDEGAGAGFPALLLSHLGGQREVPFARDYLDKSYELRKVLRSEDGMHMVIVLESVDRNTLALKYAYAYLALGDTPHIVTHLNTSSLDSRSGMSREPGCTYKGLYRLSILGARLCYGETKDLPEIDGNTVKIRTYNRLMRFSMYDYMTKHYTPTTCQGHEMDSFPGSPPGVRFYFSTEEDMIRFASSLTGAFPRISTSPPG